MLGYEFYYYNKIKGYYPTPFWLFYAYSILFSLHCWGETPKIILEQVKLNKYVSMFSTQVGSTISKPLLS
jgi:hypothetical protein